MKKSLLFISIFIILIFLSLPGCTSNPANRSKQFSGKYKDAKNNSTSASDSSYYYYMLSRLYNKKSELPLAIDLLKKAIDNDPESIFLKEEMINFYLAQDNFDEATKFAEKILAADPDAIDTLFTLAGLKIKKKEIKEAIKIYNKILDLEPNNKDTYLLLGKICNNEKHPEEMFKLYSKMLEHFPDSYIAHYYLGMAYLEQNKLNDAEEEFLKTIELSPKLIEPRLQLIEIYKMHTEKQKNPSKKIINAYKTILEIEKHNDFALMEYALYMHTHGLESKSKKIFFDFGKRSSNDETLLLQIANEYIAKKRFEDASVIFFEMLKAAPDNSSFNFFLGYAFDSLKHYQKALECYQKVKAPSPYYKKSIIYTAFLHRDNNNKSIEILEKYHNTDLTDLDIITILSNFYIKAKAIDKCINILNKGLSVSKDNPTLLLKLAICLDKKPENKSKCIKIIKKVIQLEPENAEALNYLGYTYAEIGINLDEAAILIKKALKIKPDDGFITDSLGWVYYQKGAYSKASALLQKAAELTSYDPIITEHLGDSYSKENKLKKALFVYKKASENTTEDSNEQKIKLEQKIKELEVRINAQE